MFVKNFASWIRLIHLNKCSQRRNGDPLQPTAKQQFIVTCADTQVYTCPATAAQFSARAAKTLQQAASAQSKSNTSHFTQLKIMLVCFSPRALSVWVGPFGSSHVGPQNQTQQVFCSASLLPPAHSIRHPADAGEDHGPSRPCCVPTARHKKLIALTSWSLSPKIHPL